MADLSFFLRSHNSQEVLILIADQFNFNFLFKSLRNGNITEIYKYFHTKKQKKRTFELEILNRKNLVFREFFIIKFICYKHDI